jgi:hypothetical protein
MSSETGQRILPSSHSRSSFLPTSLFLPLLSYAPRKFPAICISPALPRNIGHIHKPLPFAASRSMRAGDSYSFCLL